MKYVIVALMLVMLSSCGKDGAQGVAGAQGAQGATGSRGPVGEGLVALTVPATVAQCANGGNNTFIAQDTVGTGVWDGADVYETSFVTCNGESQTQLSTVQFCPGTTVYPSEFNEVGFLIGGRIYGVYSTNGGFMAYLPPGAYTSNAVGSSCNFTINVDNTITD